MSQVPKYWLSQKIRHRALYLLMVICVWPQPLYSQESEPEQGMFVFYPKIREPFLKIFTDMVEGIEQCYGGHVLSYAVPKDSNRLLIKKRIKQYNPDIVVALGRRSYDEFIAHSGGYPLLLGALKPIQSDDIIGIAQTPSAQKTLEKLQLITLNVKKISVVYSSEKSQSLIDEAKDFIKNNESELAAYNVSSLQEAANAFQKILLESSQGDAIWLMNNKSILDKTLLNEILEQAWEKKLIVFSSRPGLEKRGVAFSIYPDNYLFGQRLGQFANEFSDVSNGCQGMNFDDVKIGINERTLEHLGIKLSRDQRNGLSLLYPAK